MTELQKSLLAELRAASEPGAWVAVAEIFRRQWKALERRGLIEYRPGGRQHTARVRNLSTHPPHHTQKG